MVPARADDLTALAALATSFIDGTKFTGVRQPPLSAFERHHDGTISPATLDAR